LRQKTLSTSSTKVKIFLSVTLLTLGLAFALYLGIRSFNQISNSAETLAKPNQTPLFISQLLVDLVEAEGHFRSYTLTQQDTFLVAYQQKNLELSGWIDSLRTSTTRTDWQSQLDSLQTLIDQKMSGLNTFMELKAELDKQIFTDQALRKLSKDVRRPVKINKALTKTETQTQQQIKAASQVKVEPLERKGIIDKIFGKKKTQTVLVPSDSNITTTTREVTVDTITITQQPSETVLANVKTTLRALKEQESINRRQLSTQELALLGNDQKIMNRMRALIHELELEEYATSERSIAQARRVVEDSLLIIFMVVCTGLLTSVIFAMLAIRDISKGNSIRRQLLDAKQKAEKLSQVKEEFLANMSHEMRTPLNAIQGFSEQLQQANLPHHQQEQVQAIRHSSEFLLATVNDILDMSKIEAGQLHFEKLNFNLLEIARQCINIMAPRAIAKGLRFEEDLPIAPVWIIGDPFRLQQIIFNLLGNAIKFTDQGAVRLRVRARDNGYGIFVIDVSVLDTGIGIPSNKLRDIFSSFTQADTSITRRFGGTGLGLSITRRLVELQDGQINVRSRASRGTLFYLSIPYPRGKAEVQIPAQIVKSSTKVKTDWHDRRILVVDDDPLNGLLLTTILNKWKIPHTLAGNAQEALTALESRNFDLILTDMHMPGMSGLELLHKIRESDYAGLPVVVVTANAQKRDLDEYIKQGMADYLLKPFTESELRQLLIRIWPSDPEADQYPINTSTVQSKDSKLNSTYSSETFEQYAGGDQDALQTMLLSFLENTKSNLADLNREFAASNLNEVREIAHRMYPAVKQFKAEDAADCLKEIELEASNKEAMEPLVQELQELLSALIQWVEEKVSALA
jgi:signal transduction histidine kinase/response regulator of citrate/malate metabolism